MVGMMMNALSSMRIVNNDGLCQDDKLPEQHQQPNLPLTDEEPDLPLPEQGGQGSKRKHSEGKTSTKRDKLADYFTIKSTKEVNVHLGVPVEGV